MENNIKVCFFDIDGTIYEHRLHDFPHSTQSALYRLKENGYRIVIATSRCRHEMQHTPSFFRSFPWDAVIYDGGAVMEIDHEVVMEKTIDALDMEKIIKVCNEKQLYMRYANYAVDHFNRPFPTELSDIYFQLYLMVPTVKPYAGEGVTNMLLYADDETMTQLKKTLNASNIVDHQALYEITAKGVNKASAIEEIIQRWGYSMHEVIAFGDGYNDVEMLKRSGIGVAMGNGCEEAKAAADYVAAEIGKDGLYKACRHFGLIKEDLI